METLNGQLAVASFFVTFVLCYIFAYLKGTTRKQRFAQTAKAAGYVTEGTCVHTRVLRWYDAGQISNRQTTRVVTYAYYVDGVKYKMKISYFAQDDHEPLPPEKISIYYNSRNPKKSVGAPEVSRLSQLQSGCIVTIILPFLVGWAVNILVGLIINCI